MLIEELIHRYGYLTVIIGTVLEGETMVIAGAALTIGGYLSLPWVILSAVVGSLCGDQFFYWTGRKYGLEALLRTDTLKKKSEKVYALLRRRQTAVILCFRFCYGFRAVVPMLIGAAGIGPRRFFVLNFISASIWATLVAFAGFQAGHAAEFMLSHPAGRECLSIILLLLVFAAVSIFFLRRKNPSRLPVVTDGNPESRVLFETVEMSTGIHQDSGKIRIEIGLKKPH